MAKHPSRDEVLHSLQMIIEACDSVIWRTSFSCEERFLSDRAMVADTATDLHVIGYHAGKLPKDVRRGSSELDDAYGFRHRMAEGYGLLTEETDYIRRAVFVDVYLIRDHCLESMRRILKLIRADRACRRAGFRSR